MSKRKLNLIIIIWLGISALSFFAIAFYCSQYQFLKTTGFYFTGIDKNEIGEIKATGFNKQHQPVRMIFCLEHYRKTDKYIYDDWRWDFKYYDLIDSIHLIIPDKLLPKIEKVWYKYDKTVTCLSKEELVNTWPHKQFENDIYFFIPNNLKQKKSFFDGIMCMINVKGNLFRTIRYAMVSLTFIGVFMIFFRFFSTIKMTGKFIFTRIKNVYSKHRRFFNRLFSFLLGILFTLMILEVTLRIAGYIHNQKNIEKQIKKDVKTKDVIICVGDSFTESIGSTDGNDYPSQFERIINRDTNRHYTVLNFGRSGKNTAQIALEVPVYIKNYNPGLIVLMAGSANYWNYWGYDKDGADASFRFVTFFKLLFQNIQNKRHENVFKPEEYIKRRDEYLLSLKKTNNYESPVLKAIRTHNYDIIRKYADSCQKSGFLSEKDIFHLMLFSSFSGESEHFCHLLKNFKTNSEHTKFFLLLVEKSKDSNSIKISDFSLVYQSVYYYLNELKKSKFDENVLQKCISLNPYLEDAYFQLFSLGYRDISLPGDYNQNRFSIIDTINYYKHLYRLENNNNFINVNIDENLKGGLETKKIDQWVSRDIGKVIDICKQNGIKVILMNYPIKNNTTLFFSVNGIIKNIAEKNNIPFVDNGQIFDNITIERNSYFISDGHCSDKGYELISNNIYRVISSHHLLDSIGTKVK